MLDPSMLDGHAQQLVIAVHARRVDQAPTDLQERGHRGRDLLKVVEWRFKAVRALWLERCDMGLCNFRVFCRSKRHVLGVLDCV